MELPVEFLRWRITEQIIAFSPRENLLQSFFEVIGIYRSHTAGGICERAQSLCAGQRIAAGDQRLDGRAPKGWIHAATANRRAADAHAQAAFTGRVLKTTNTGPWLQAADIHGVDHNSGSTRVVDNLIQH